MVLMRTRLALLLFGALAAPLAAQDWGVGASIGLVNDVEDQFRLDDFGNQDANAWVEFRLEEQVLLRAAIGSMDVKGENAGRLAQLVPGSPPTALPDLETSIEYVTVSVSYQFWDGDFTSGRVRRNRRVPPQPRSGSGSHRGLSRSPREGLRLAFRRRHGSAHLLARLLHRAPHLPPGELRIRTIDPGRQRGSSLPFLSVHRRPRSGTLIATPVAKLYGIS